MNEAADITIERLNEHIEFLVFRLPSDLSYTHVDIIIGTERLSEIITALRDYKRLREAQMARPNVRFVQITSARVENNAATQADWILHALDSVGRIWQIDNYHPWHEVALPNVQPETNE